METEYEARKQKLLDESAEPPQVFGRVMPRLERFMKPFLESFVRREQRGHAGTFVQGLLPDLEHKPKMRRGVNTESIAYRFDQ